MSESDRNQDNAAAETGAARTGTGRTALALALCALLAALAALAGAGWLWYQGDRRLVAQQTRLAAVEQGLATEVREGLRPRVRELEQRLAGLAEETGARGAALAELQTRLGNTRLQISELAELVEGGHRRWQLLEVESLLAAANERLLLYRDPAGAKQALSLADQRLAQLDDPRLFKVRERVVDEIAALNALPDVDVDGLALSLTKLIERVPELPLASRVPSDYSDDGPAGGGTDTTSAEQAWRHFLDSLGKALEGMVTLRRDGDTYRPLMPPEQDFFLYQNLLLKLESARLALLQRRTDTFRNTLATARSWLQRYFDGDDPRVAGALETLNGMRGLQLDWDAPDITTSLDALREVLRREARAQAGADTADAN